MPVRWCTVPFLIVLAGALLALVGVIVLVKRDRVARWMAALDDGASRGRLRPVLGPIGFTALFGSVMVVVGVAFVVFAGLELG